VKKIIFLGIIISTVTHLFCQVQPGDVNEDNRVNIVDALLVAQYYVGLNPPDFVNIGVSDVNCDGGTNIVDALLIARFYVGLITELQECPPSETPTPEPTPEVTPVGDAWMYRANDSGIYVVEPEMRGTYDFIVLSDNVEIDKAIPGYTGNGYVRSYGLPASVRFYIYNTVPGGYEIRFRTYNAGTGEWVFTGYTEPAVYDFEWNQYFITLSFSESDYYIDRMIIFPTGTEAVLWQDLSISPDADWRGVGGSEQAAFVIR
jgi:hypothetical protein